MALGGTSFRGANLEDADFDEARLRNTDFRGATIERTRWNEPRELDFCRFDPGVRVPHVPRGSKKKDT